MWEFWIDVGGTFTDCLARDPDNRLTARKILSSGITKGRAQFVAAEHRLIDVRRTSDGPEFWNGYGIRLLDQNHHVLMTSTVSGFDCATGSFAIRDPWPESTPDWVNYELFSDEEAVLVAIRQLLRLRRDQPIPPIAVRLGTTRGTNALLTRRGARTAFVTTRGFADILRIANQDRPKLFDLTIRKPEPLYEIAIEIDERVDALGNVIRALDQPTIRRQFDQLKRDGIESVAICLMHAFAFPEHEHIVAAVAQEAGFGEISVSSQLAPQIKIVSRGETTVADAYLNPILRRYVQSLQASMHDTTTASTSSLTTDEFQSAIRSTVPTLRLMTSAGGLVAANQFTGKDCILSGPAGGVIGFSKIAQAAGFAKSIGFDMGGTSTDVARFDGRYELQYESVKAGVRVVAPMLAIETVAAGGGSVCRFDGVKLTVGPDSAGADPGPACYGRGGPLTVTDMNLLLGRILPDRFPFPLDVSTVEQRLQQLCDQIAKSAEGVRYTPLQLAEGFIRIANANMVRPIRSISIARGYDPREYVLVAFGSAGGQHACAIARELGISQILSHRFAGLLSAYGMGLAEIRRHAEHAVLKSYSPSQVLQLEPQFEALELRCVTAIIAEGINRTDIQPAIRSLDLRYHGTESTINVSLPADGDYAKRYEELHQQLYGYRHAQREIEIAVMRVELVSLLNAPFESSQVVTKRRPSAAYTTSACFEGHLTATDVFTREQLLPGDEVIGPAIICEPTSTIVIDPGFYATVLSRGEILIARQDLDSTPVSDTITADTADPILLEIFNNQFAAIAEQMGVTLRRTAFSTNVKERLDFSCAIFTSQGDLVVNAPHIPVHLGAMAETVKRVIQDNPVMHRGDVFVTNDPYRGGSHLPDITVITPFHDDVSGELIFFTASRAHHAEIGGISPGSMPPFSKSLAEEGVLIRNFRYIDQGQIRDDTFRDLLQSGAYPTRALRDNLADLAAQVAANQSGTRALGQMIARYSAPVVVGYMRHIQLAAERKTRMALSAIPAGQYRWTDHLDDGSPLCVTITLNADGAIVDFDGTGPVLPGNLNANRSIVTAAVLYVFRCLINEDIPLNSGVLAPISIQIPECFLNPPEHDDPVQCAAIVGGNVETSQRVVDVLLGALGLAAASQGTMNNLTFGDDTFGYYETICGGSGATEGADGADAVHTHMTNTRLTDPEVLEWRYPVRLQEFSIRHDSGGSGRWQGGNGVIRRLEFLKPLRLSLLTERRGPYPPFGLEGGHSGACGRNTLQRAQTSQIVDLGGKVQTTVQAGDVLTIETPGGGGFGA